MAAEIRENNTTCFLDSVRQMSNIDVPGSSLVDEFLQSVLDRKVEIRKSNLVHDLRLQVDSLDGKIFVFIPDVFSDEWGGDIKFRALTSLIFDTISCIRGLSGPSMWRFDNLKRSVL